MLAASRDAHAYIDPGTGSYMFQIVLAAILGGIFTLKSYGKRAVNALFNRRRRKDE